MLPHRTHRNGLSIDFMMPKLQNGKPYYGLDDLGAGHYALTFNDEGKYEKDKSISIDFELIARHLLILDAKSRKQGIKITKVIIKMEMKDELYAGAYGKQLKTSGIYVTRNLTPGVNAMHDEHYHVDFGPI
jgi:penicillin-insensitive murein endopeptidase